MTMTNIVIFDVDGTLTPHPGGKLGCLYSSGWENYKPYYSNLEGVKYIGKMLNLLVENDYIILYNSNNYKDNIIKLFNFYNIMTDGGNSRETPFGKIDYIDNIGIHYKNSNIFYLEDDKSYLNMSTVNNISCADGMWLGKQLKIIVECLKFDEEIPDDVYNLYIFLQDISKNILIDFNL